MKKTYIQRLHDLHGILAGLRATDRRGLSINPQAAFAKLLKMTLATKAGRNAIFMVGNGASASMASHIAADLCKNAHLCTEVFSDSSLLTAVANDVGTDYLFAVPLKQRGRKNDILVAISSSGNSRNILEAVKTARKMGLKVITFSAMQPDNALRRTGDLNFYVKADTYGMAESAHAVLLHYWVDMLSC